MHVFPTTSLHMDLLDARLELRQHLMGEYEIQLKCSKIAHYNLMSKPNKLMARRVAVARHKTKIPYILSQTHAHKICHPLAIADTFSYFYSKLYNLKEDPHITSPTTRDIDLFLRSIALLSISEDQLNNLNSPFTKDEISCTFKSLPNGESPGPDGYANEYLK